MWTVWKQSVCLLIFYITCSYGFPKQTLKKKNSKELLHHVTTKTISEAGGSKRTIMIGSRRCGKSKIGRHIDILSHNVTKRAAKHLVNLDEMHKDLHATGENIEISREIAALRQNKKDDHVIRPQGNTWFDRLDVCCENHDACARIIPAKSESFGYENNMDYNVFDCVCDDLFSVCLKTADSYTADAVGTLYFNTLKPPCVDFPEASHKLPLTKSLSQAPVDQSLAEHVSLVTDTGENDKTNRIAAAKPVERLAQHYTTVSGEGPL